MLSIYIAAAAIGGILALVGAFAGDHGHEHQFGGDGHEIGHDHDSGHADVWIPFFSVRFWTYFAMAFGLSGVLLSTVAKQVEPLVAILSSATALLLGLAVSYTIRALSRTEHTSTVTEKDLVGTEGQVMVAIRDGQLGRIRITVKGEILDLLASCAEPKSIEAGEFVVVVDLDGDRVRVVSRESAFGSSESLNA
jgi:membrane protein implicated in regulation of membrane protease activity